MKWSLGDIHAPRQVVSRKRGKKKTSVEELLEKETRRKTKKVTRQGTREKGVIIVEMETLEAKQEFMRNKNKLGARKVYM